MFGFNHSETDYVSNILNMIWVEYWQTAIHNPLVKIFFYHQMENFYIYPDSKCIELYGTSATVESLLLFFFFFLFQQPVSFIFQHTRKNKKRKNYEKVWIFNWKFSSIPALQILTLLKYNLIFVFLE